MDCAKLHVRRRCEHITFASVVVLSFALIIITGAALQFTDTQSDAAYAKFRELITTSPPGQNGVGPCLLGIVGGFNACNYTYAVGAVGIMMMIACFMHHESWFSPEPVLGLLSAKAYIAAFGTLWFLGAAIGIGILNDPRFSPASCIACGMARAEQRNSIWAICFALAGLCFLLLVWFFLEQFYGASAPPLLAAMQGRLFTYGTRGDSHRSQSTLDPSVVDAANAAALAAAAENQKVYAKSRFAPGPLQKVNSEAAAATSLLDLQTPQGKSMVVDVEAPAPEPEAATAQSAPTLPGAVQPAQGGPRQASATEYFDCSA